MQTTGYNGSLDLLRVLGAVAIVHYHLGLPFQAFSLAALPVFVMVLVYFGVDRPFFVSAKRLLFPWLLWSAVYTVLKVAQAKVEGTPVMSEFAPWMILTGTSLHLWFLPFCLGWLGLAKAAKLIGTIWVRQIAPLVASVLALWMFARETWPIPIAQWLTVVPAAFAGVAMRRTEQPIIPALVLASLLLFGYRDMTLQLGLAGILVAIALLVPFPSPPALRRLSGAAFGVYLIHPAVIAFVAILQPQPTWATWFGVVVLSYLVTLGLQRWAPSFV